MGNDIDYQVAFQNFEAQINRTDNLFSQWIETGEDWYDPSWYIESCFLQLLAVAEALKLPEFFRIAHTEYLEVKNSKGGFNKAISDPDGDYHSIVLSRISCFNGALRNLYPKDLATTFTKDLLQIIRDIHYSITNTTVFPNVPANESEVHERIEAILKCVFPDLKHKPTLTKQIKNFIPDTGIPSLQTLIEYKFLSHKKDIGPIADQLLADTRGYTSKDWTQFIYVIYETNRFRTERDWNQFLRESGVPINTTIVVLSGEPTA